jgi:hypothetical protein
MIKKAIQLCHFMLERRTFKAWRLFIYWIVKGAPHGRQRGPSSSAITAGEDGRRTVYLI